jgi:hypothetical protein
MGNNNDPLVKANIRVLNANRKYWLRKIREAEELITKNQKACSHRNAKHYRGYPVHECTNCGAKFTTEIGIDVLLDKPRSPLVPDSIS